jgi:hypothetical protein
MLLPRDPHHHFGYFHCWRARRWKKAKAPMFLVVEEQTITRKLRESSLLLSLFSHRDQVQTLRLTLEAREEGVCSEISFDVLMNLVIVMD